MRWLETTHCSRLSWRRRFEHSDLRKGVDDLATGAPGSDWSDFHVRFTSFCSVLATHEQAENDLLSEAYLRDVGGHH